MEFSDELVTGVERVLLRGGVIDDPHDVELAKQWEMSMNGLSTHPSQVREFGLAEVILRGVHQGVNHVADAAVLSQDTPAAWILITEIRHVFVRF